MRTPTSESSERQPWQPTHWVTMSGYALAPCDLHFGTTKCDEAKDLIRAASDTDVIIRKVMQS